MSRVATALVRALRHPGLIIAFYCQRTVFAAGGALLWAGAFAPDWIMALPRRDASLFQPGLLLPIRLFAENQSGWLERARVSLWLVLAFIVTGAIVTAYVLHAMTPVSCPGERRAWPSVSSLLRHITTVGASWILVLLATYAARQLAGILPPLVYRFFGEKGADVTLVAVALLLLFTIVVVRVGCDLTRAGLTLSQGPLLVIAATVGNHLRARWWFWLGTYACFTLPALAMPILVGVWFPSLDDRDGIAGRFFAQQAAVLAVCALQLGWWALVLAHAPVPSQQKDAEQSLEIGGL